MPSGENQYEEEVLFLVSPVEVESQRRKADAACGLTCHDGSYEEQYCQLSKLTSMMSSLFNGIDRKPCTDPAPQSARSCL
jgi:hypothetical protein